MDAYVLLGDPGSGKTSLLAREAKETAGEFVSARDFLTLQCKSPIKGGTLFIDGLDETRVGSEDFRGPLDRIRARLDELGRPRFRLSCREADWLGASDRQALANVSPSGQLRTLHLDPFTDKQVIQFLDRYIGAQKGEEFVEAAKTSGLDGLLSNPQTLVLLAEALRENEWPNSRNETYEFACRQLVGEPNEEHRAAKRPKSIRVDKLLDAAGYLGALTLLSDRPSITYDIYDSESIALQSLTFALPVEEVLRTRLFRCTKENHFSFVHRSVAEFLAARFIGRAIDHGDMDLNRVMSLMIGTDAGVVSGLRGLHSWLAISSKANRTSLIDRDPLGVVLYGDVRTFSTDEKRALLTSLSRQAEQYSRFRWQDWSSSPFGAISTKDMVPDFEEILGSSLRDEAHQAFLNCVLDALYWGEPLPDLAASLIRIVRDSSYWSVNRRTALNAYEKLFDASHDELAIVANEILAGQIDDDDDELIGNLLTVLYPQHIGPDSVLDYLHAEKAENLLGSYMMFWGYKLAENSDSTQIRILLDRLAETNIDWQGQRHDHVIRRFIGETLSRGLEECGESASDEQLTKWLGVGLDKYHSSKLYREHHVRIQAWISDNPDRYKSVFGKLIAGCEGSENIRYCFHKCRQRLYGANQPSDLGLWFLGLSGDSSDADFSRQCFEEAIHCLFWNIGDDGLSLEYIEDWLVAQPSLAPHFATLLHTEIPEWRFEQAQYNAEHEAKKEQNIEKSNRYFREIQHDIRAGTANAQTLHHLASAYFGRFYECSGDTEIEKLASILGGDSELVSASLEGFRNALRRKDLPSIKEIASTNSTGKVHFVSLPCLAGAQELCRSNTEFILELDDFTLSKLICFSYFDGGGQPLQWLELLNRKRPGLVAATLVEYVAILLKRRVKHISVLYSLAHDPSTSEVALGSALPLLQELPADACLYQASQLDYLLIAAIRHVDRQDLVSLIEEKLSISRMTIWQRTYWLACGLTIAFDKFEHRFRTFVGARKRRAQYAASFLASERDFASADLVDDMAAICLVQVLAPFYDPRESAKSGLVTPAMRAAEFVQSLITKLSNSPSKHIETEINSMLSEIRLSSWHDRLKHALVVQRVNRRELLFVHPTQKQVENSLANGQPANPSDLSTLTYSILQDLANHIRHGNTDLYKQFWNTDGYKKPTTPRVEEICRNLLLDMLKERLKTFGVDAQREGSYAEDARGDIRVSFGGTDGFNVPIEIKRDKHDDVWTAMHEQLIAKYTRDPGAAGFGIFLVFWFNTGMPSPPNGQSKPTTAGELERLLKEQLSIEESRFISVVVIDVQIRQ